MWSEIHWKEKLQAMLGSCTLLSSMSNVGVEHYAYECVCKVLVMRNQFSCNRNTSFGKASMQTKETHTKEQRHVRKDLIENGVCHIRGHLQNGPNVRHAWSRLEEWLCNFLCNFGFCAGRNDKIISDCRNSAKYQAFADTSLGIVALCSLLPWHQGTDDDTEYICM